MRTAFIDKEAWKDDFSELSGALSGWPGKVSDDGLCAVHLSPDCELRKSPRCFACLINIFTDKRNC